MKDPIPLTNPDNQVLAWQCGQCKRMHDVDQSNDDSTLVIAYNVNNAKEYAIACCKCRNCDNLRNYGDRCEDCYFKDEEDYARRFFLNPEGLLFTQRDGVWTVITGQLWLYGHNVMELTGRVPQKFHGKGETPEAALADLRHKQEEYRAWKEPRTEAALEKVCPNCEHSSKTSVCSEARRACLAEAITVCVKCGFNLLATDFTLTGFKLTKP